MTTFTIKGVNDDRDFCECCGRQGLVRVVWIQNDETGEVRHFGTSCAASPRNAFGLTPAQVRAASADFEHWEKFIHWDARKRYREAGGLYTPSKHNAAGAAIAWAPAQPALYESCRIGAVAAHPFKGYRIDQGAPA